MCMGSGADVLSVSDGAGAVPIRAPPHRRWSQAVATGHALRAHPGWHPACVHRARETAKERRMHAVGIDRLSNSDDIGPSFPTRVFRVTGESWRVRRLTQPRPLCLRRKERNSEETVTQCIYCN